MKNADASPSLLNKGRKMANEKKKVSTPNTKQKKKRARVEFKGYISRNISASEKSDYKNARAGGWDWTVKLDELLSDGYTAKWGWDEYNEAYSATLYDQNPNSEHGGYCLSYRAGDPFEAMDRLFWVHFVLLQGSWENIAPEYDSDEW